MKYLGINVDNVFLRNVDVELCQARGTETLAVRNVKKVHSMIALGIALQPARLSGAEVKFLRKASRMSLSETANRLGIADATFSRWESGRPLGEQVEKLFRIEHIARTSSELPSFINPVDLVNEIAMAKLVDCRDFAIVINMEELERLPQYENMRSVDYAPANISSVEAQMFELAMQAVVKVGGANLAPQFIEGRPELTLNQCDAGKYLQIAA
jgi:putative transcriptional regulator